MDTIEVPQVCALALNNLPIVGRPIWRLTEGKHIVKLEITWQLPRTQTSRQSNQPSKTKKYSADGVTGGVTKMVEKKMVVPTLTSMEDELNVAVCSTPSIPQDSMASTEGQSTHSPADTMTDHSPEGEWKEVVSKKAKKKLSMSPRKPTSPAKIKDSSMGQGRKSPSPPPKKTRVRSPLQEPSREKLIATKGQEYPLHKKYDLDEVVTDQLLDKTRYFIIRAYRLPRWEEQFNVIIQPTFFTSSGRPCGTWQRGPRPSTTTKTTTMISRGDLSGLVQ